MEKYDVNFKLKGSIELEAETLEGLMEAFEKLAVVDVLDHIEGWPVMVGFCGIEKMDD